jgi:DNA-binding transcriptional LysR family regulator
MRVRQIEAFQAVMRSAGITAAASLLNISQPSVSRLIADLEHEVGFALFARRGGRMHPTQQGLALYEAVRRSFQGLDLLDQAARRIRAHPVGTIRIAALSALAAAVLPPVLEEFGRDYPELKVTVESLGQRAIEDRVFLGQADLGLAVEIEPRDGIRAALLADAEYVCVLPPGHPLCARTVVEAQDLTGETFIGAMHEADAIWFGVDRLLDREGVVVRRRLETQHSFPAYAFVAAGLGVTIAEPFSVPMFTRLGVQVRRFRPTVSLKFCVLEPDLGPTPPNIDLFRARIFESTAALLHSVALLIGAD